MKKTFTLVHPKIKFARLVDSARCDIKRYIKRERKKKLPEGVDFWDFDCKFGTAPENAKTIHIAEIGKFITQIEDQQLESFYIEVLAKPGHRTKKPVSQTKK